MDHFFSDKPVILILVYYECPMLCNVALDGLVRSLNELSFDVGKEFTVLTVSFNHRETPRQAAKKKRTILARYGRHGAAKGWHFLSGRKKSIRKLADSVGFQYEYDPETGQYAHAAGLMILTPKGKISRYFYGVEHAPRQLRLGLIEASNNKIATPTDQILLFCYQYDPTTGKYGLAVMNALRVAGLLTVVGIGSTIWILLRRERRPSQPTDSGQTSQAEF